MCGSRLNNTYKLIADGSSYLLPLFFLNAVVYVSAIILFPSFSGDDFYIFYLIDKNPGLPISLNPNEIYYLFLRPVSYFSFWADYHLFYTNSFLMKMVSLIIHLLQAGLLFRLLAEISECFKLRKDYRIISLLVLIYSFHPDVMLYILHINNRTELLMIFFYTGALLAFFMFVNGKLSNTQLLITILPLWLLSVLSKQSGLHLPLIMLTGLSVITISRRKKRTIFILSAAMMVMASVFSYLNYEIIGIVPQDFSIFWEKPLAAAGTLLFVVIPPAAEQVYSFFLQNKILAFAAALLLFTIGVTVIRGKRVTISALKFLGFLGIIFYPRILALGGGRINTHLLLWFLILILFASTQVKSSILFITIGGYILLLFSFSLLQLKSAIEIENYRIQEIISLKEMRSRYYPKELFVTISGFGTLAYQYKFLEENRFGKAELGGHPLIFKSLFPGMESKRGVINYHWEKDKLIYTADDPDYFIGNHPINRSLKKYSTYPEGSKLREYKSFALELPDHIINNRILIHHNGNSWVKIN